LLLRRPVSYPADPEQAYWTYTQGTDLRDPTLRELAGYYSRLVSWYTQGGFRDEYGKLHQSGHHYKFDHWEVLNEPNIEHNTTPEQYTARCDAIVDAIRKTAPQMKFVGMSISHASASSLFQYMEYFLDSKHHRPGIPIDTVSYHYYAHPSADEPPESWPFSVFQQTAQFVNEVGYAETIRQRLAPQTRTAINEVGVILPQDFEALFPGYAFKPFPAFFWNLSAAQFAYLYVELAKIGIDAVGE
jgi:hypothetical protein